MSDRDRQALRRRAAWAALSELFLDTALDDEDIARIAGALAASGFSLAELHDMLVREVAPVVGGNVLTTAGVWSGFDEQWLSTRVKRRSRRCRRAFSLTGWLALRVVRADWDRLRERLSEQ